MKKIVATMFLVSFCYMAFAQYDNSEKVSLLAGFTSTGSEFVFWQDNVYGGNIQLIYDVKKIEEGAIGIKLTTELADGYNGYYGGLNFRIGSRFFGDMDLLFGHSSLTNEKLLSNYGANVTEYSGAGFIWDIGIGYRFASNPLFIRMAYSAHTPMGHAGLNTIYSIQLGFRIK